MNRGDAYVTPDGDRIVVTRVGRADPTWADIRVVQANGATWTKRQRRPFPDVWRQIGVPLAVRTVWTGGDRL